MKVHQFLTSYSYGDAIGNEASDIKNFLRNQGIESEIFALFYHPKFAHQVKNYLEYDRYSDKNNIVIFHFSIGSPVSKKFLRLPDKKVIIYHNITPYHFFLDYHRVLAKDCYKGKIELSTFKDDIDLALGDSEFNRQELETMGFRRTGVLPLLIDFSKFNSDKLQVFDEIFSDKKINILYVGRIIPNKKIEDIIKIFYFYQNHFNKNSRLFIIGEYLGFERYLYSLQQMTQQLTIKNIHFSGHIPLEELISYYKSSHIYLHMSEHEGFCAPIPESFYLNIPVVAFKTGAVEETMNKGGILVNSKRYLEIAALIDRIINDKELKQHLLNSQKKAMEKYQRQRSGQILLDYLKQIHQQDLPQNP